MRKRPFSLGSKIRRFHDRRGKIASALFAATVLAVIVFFMISGIRTWNGSYVLNGPSAAFDMPLRLSGAPAGMMTVQFNLRLGAIHPTHFLIIPDDCLELLVINDAPVDDHYLPLCEYSKGSVFDLSKYIHSGDNTVEMQVRNAGGDAKMLFQTAWSDLAVLLPAAILVIAIAMYCIFILMRLRTPSWVKLLCILFVVASLFRLYYTLSTPYWVRGHDTDGHIEYIDHLVQEGSLPTPGQGWEAWQPPLYYLLGALWIAPADWLGMERTTALFGLQVLSLLLSIATLGIVVWIGLRLFQRDERPVALPLFFSLIAFFPGLIYLSARINNDVLAITLAFLAVALLIRWWQVPTRRLWMALIAVIALHILTKNNGILLLPVAFIGLLLQKKQMWKRKLKDIFIGLAIVGVIAGSFSVYRAMQGHNQDMIGNVQTLHSGLLLTNKLENYLVFNPLMVISIPYNNPWDDAARRQFFWEYWYKSAFFGEFHFGEDRKFVASWILLLGMVLCFCALIGCIRSIRKNTSEYLPLLLLFVILSLGHMLFRSQYPYGSSQDFRYSLVLLVPLALYITLSYLFTRTKFLQKGMMYVTGLFIGFCVAFLLHS